MISSEIGGGVTSGSGADSGGGSNSVDVGKGAGSGRKKNHHISPIMKVIMKTARIPRISRPRLGGLAISSSGIGIGIDGGIGGTGGSLGGNGIFGMVGGAKTGGTGRGGSSLRSSAGGNDGG